MYLKIESSGYFRFLVQSSGSDTIHNNSAALQSFFACFELPVLVDKLSINHLSQHWLGMRTTNLKMDIFWAPEVRKQ